MTQNPLATLPDPGQLEEDSTLLLTGLVDLPVFQGPRISLYRKESRAARRKAGASAMALTVRARLLIRFISHETSGPYLGVDAILEDKTFTQRHGLIYTDGAFLAAARALVRDICRGSEEAPFGYTEHGMQTDDTVSMEAGGSLFAMVWRDVSAHDFLRAGSDRVTPGGFFWRSRLGVVDTRDDAEQQSWPA